MKKVKSILACVIAVLGLQNAMADDCFKLQGRSLQTLEIGQTFQQSGTLDISRRDFIAGFAISGQITKSSPEYVVRVIMTDTEGKEHLVMECYEELNSDSVFNFTDYCEETAILNGVCPSTLKVILKDATLRITQTTVANARSRRTADRNFEVRIQSLRQSQTSAIIDKINAYNIANNRLWRAGETALTQYDNAERRKYMGLKENASSCGLEYYVDGIFEMGHANQYRANDPSLIESFDWRTRHGKNLMTSIKDQTGETCSAFATIGCVEALVNLYYNRHVDLDLSEMELMCCADATPHNYLQALPINKAIMYVANHGVCDESTYPFSTTLSPVCVSDTITPVEQVSLDDYDYVLTPQKHLFTNGPLVACVDGGMFLSGHAMVLVGYGKVHLNDTIGRVYNVETNSYITQFVDPYAPQIGMNYWIFKNSWGDPSPYNTHGGYLYMLDTDNSLSFKYGLFYPLYAQGHSDSEIVWEDKDGDGLYNWGIGHNKPSSCPSWVPGTPDGDDNDPTKANINSQTGYCYNFTPEDHPITIDYVETYSSAVQVSTHLTITNGGVLTITDRLHCIGNPVITLDGTGELIIDGGYIYNAELNLSSSSKLTIKNGGKISVRRGKSFTAPLGAVVTIESGSIENM